MEKIEKLYQFASLPAIAFLLLGAYGKVIWLILSVITIGVGYIGIHIQHYLKLLVKYY